jgi:hypothetical protein
VRHRNDCRNRENAAQKRQCTLLRVATVLTHPHDCPSHSCKRIGPRDDWAAKFGATSPSARCLQAAISAASLKTTESTSWSILKDQNSHTLGSSCALCGVVRVHLALEAQLVGLPHGAERSPLLRSHEFPLSVTLSPERY